MSGTTKPIRRVAILGTRGIPARYGGFETFAEYLALHLVRQGWEVEVYCPDEDGTVPAEWRGVRLRGIPVGRGGALGSVIFDWKSTLAAARNEKLVLNLGYNTGIFGLLLRSAGCRNLINMDGVEWKRQKWSLPIRWWFWANEWIAARLGDHLIADSPGITDHLARHTARSKISMIAYGGARVDAADEAPVRALGLVPGGYSLIIARAEPENSILEMVRAFSAAPRGQVLAVLGGYDAAANAYQREVLAAAGPEVRFLGAIYDSAVVQALRYHATAYFHGHQVGGTNPSLVEALGAGSVVVAHDNPFNRFVAGPTARYFAQQSDLERQIVDVLSLPEVERQRLRAASWQRHADEFTWEAILAQYEALLERWAARAKAAPAESSAYGAS